MTLPHKNELLLSRVLQFNIDNGRFLVEKTRSIISSRSVPDEEIIFAYRFNIFNMLLFVITCRAHGKMLLTPFDNQLYYFPVFPLIIGDSWIQSISARFSTLLKNFQISWRTNISFQINQLKTPKFSEIIYQIVVFVDLENCESKCSKSMNQFVWVRIQDLNKSMASQLLGPEPVIYGEAANTTRFSCCGELSVQSEIKHYQKYWNLIMDTNFTENNVYEIFEEFIQHTFPSWYMNRNRFASYFSESKINLSINSSIKNEDNLYNAFLSSGKDYISFKDFLLTLVVIDRKCSHGQIGGQLRTKCMFQFYTKRGSQDIGFYELVILFEDIKNVKNPNKSFLLETAEQMAEKLFRSLQLSINQRISIHKFIELVGQLKIRGTGKILRSETSFLSEFHLKRIYSGMLMQLAKTDQLTRKSFISGNKQKCRLCAEPTFKVAMHSVKFNLEKNQLKYFQTTKLDEISQNESLMNADDNTTQNELRDILRRFSKFVFGFPKNPELDKVDKWEIKDIRLSLVPKIIKVCSTVVELFKNSPRVLKIQSPTYVFGDIHGNFKDLMIFDHLFWRMAPKGFVCNTLFLGDYVDRGDQSLECSLYLLCLKLITPNHIHMIRGNHESRIVQQQFTFYRECIDKFEKYGHFIWECFNEVFDHLPLCAVIDEEVFCSHGGIPSSFNRLENLFNIPVPLYSANTCKAAWEILWNDPVSQTEYTAFLDILQTREFFPNYPRGFLPNIKRGTAFYFSEEAVNIFLELNNLSLVIRAHEVVPAGFQFLMDGKVLTIFSCSNYCGGANEAAVVFVEEGKIRVIKVDTDTKPMI